MESLYQSFQRVRFGSVFCGNLNLNAILCFLYFAFKLFAKILSTTVKHSLSPPFILLFEDTRTNNTKNLLQEILNGINYVLIDSASVYLAISLTANKPCVLQLLKMMRDSRPRQIHTIAYHSKSLLNWTTNFLHGENRFSL
jgi:hypothetical protein